MVRLEVLIRRPTWDGDGRRRPSERKWGAACKDRGSPRCTQLENGKEDKRKMVTLGFCSKRGCIYCNNYMPQEQARTKKALSSTGFAERDGERGREPERDRDKSRKRESNKISKDGEEEYNKQVRAAHCIFTVDSTGVREWH